jgi:hypothetical protein
METQSRACPGEAEEAVAALTGQVLSVTSTATAIRFQHLRALHAGRHAQAATMPPVSAVFWVFLCLYIIK